MLAKPEDAVRAWIGPKAASKGGTQTITQAFGVRDLVLGVGTLIGLARGDAKDWVGLAAACDVVDLAATLKGDGPSSGKIVVGALASNAIAISAGYLATAS